jgi:superfamily II DNA or RNA helicase
MKLYDYQIEAVNATSRAAKGIVVLPTGTGKTIIQAEIIARELRLNKGFNIYLINAPRIILTYQLLKEVYKYMVQEKLEARYHFLHSGRGEDVNDLEQIRINTDTDDIKLPYSDIDCSTSIKPLIEIIKNSNQLDLPLIIFSTYHSAQNIELARTELKLPPVYIMLNDEAHNLVSPSFHNVITNIDSSRIYFFTATTKHTPSDSGRGMNNVDVYGDILYKLLPRDAIEMGMMVRPRVHLIKTDSVYTSDDYDRSMNLVIYNSFNQHKIYLSSNHTHITPKVLVTTRGSDDIKNFINSKYYTKLRSENVEIFAISSNDLVGCNINGVKVQRTLFLKMLKEYGGDITKNILILHIDILTEGIDVPGITAIMPFRELNKSKFIQTFGRCARLDKRDRFMLEHNIIAPSDVHKMNKPYAYVILPFITESNEYDSGTMQQFIKDLRGFGFNPSEDFVGYQNDMRGINEGEELDKFNKLTQNNMSSADIIKGIISEIEEEEIANLSPLEYLQLHL